MIGVIADQGQHDVVREFFELFKTPWELYRQGKAYQVVICASDCVGGIEGNPQLVVRYNVEIGNSRKNTTRVIVSKEGRIPVYGSVVVFSEQRCGFLTDESSRDCAGYLEVAGERTDAWIGYDLFDEVRTLLTAGQPPIYADIPTLELHIAVLRELIVRSGVALIEIPPIPEGYPFTVCLTHDVDHPSIRNHKWNHTVFGFLYRAVFGSLRNMLRGRISVESLLTNWKAALKLPFVQVGWSDDFWADFGDRYLEMEKGIRSTFFVIPFKNDPGKNAKGSAPSFRAAKYQAKNLAETIKRLTAAGCEIGLHGIDAWIDSERGREEIKEIGSLTGMSEVGVRMHWLYFDEQSPAVLERANASYDSTVGYNGAVGYRAGTAQAYKPLQVDRLLELPLLAMDTALFYPAHLGLSSIEADHVLSRLIETSDTWGGCLTINWHDRSLAPERLWDTSYRKLLEDLKSRGAWFATAGQAASWFRKRRAVIFETDGHESEAIRARVTTSNPDDLPALRVRVHQPRQSGANSHESERYTDLALVNTTEIGVPCGISR